MSEINNKINNDYYYASSQKLKKTNLRAFLRANPLEIEKFREFALRYSCDSDILDVIEEAAKSCVRVEPIGQVGSSVRN
jgi:hypothetical protein